jgi:hypothetical protein
LEKAGRGVRNLETMRWEEADLEHCSLFFSSQQYLYLAVRRQNAILKIMSALQCRTDYFQNIKESARYRTTYQQSNKRYSG